MKGKTLSRLIGEQLPGQGVFFRRSGGVVTVDRRPLAKVNRTTEDEVEILWNVPELAATGVQKQLVMGALAVQLPARQGAS